MLLVLSVILEGGKWPGADGKWELHGYRYASLFPLFFNKLRILNFIIVCVYDKHAWACTCHGVYVEVRGQPTFHLYKGSREQTQVARLARQVPLPTKLSC